MTQFSDRLVEACDRKDIMGHGRQSEIRRKLKTKFDLDLSAQCVSNWFKGATTPRGGHLEKLAEVLSVSPSWLIFGNDAEPSPLIDVTAQESNERNVRLTDGLWQFVDDLVASGGYEDSSDVVRAALRNFKIEQPPA
ncbi:helix-turn-helix domain-containing protein [Brevundimonas sp. TWP1-2-1b1]|uniref:helix-turn-helix domain-containing protein n=1 Tax=unclassified Brevundimonas TaxID=2622653 RepID=UPI003CEBB486